MKSLRFIAFFSVVATLGLAWTGCSSAPTECVGAACVCDSEDCNLACGGESQASCALKCESGSKSCALECPGGSCNMECSGTESCTLDCPGGSCNLQCSGAQTCTITSCEKSCNLQCSGASTCSSSCDTAAGCNTSS